jgi:head-tail adaptor
MVMGAGARSVRVAFDAPVSVPNGMGGTISDWADVPVVRWAHVRYLLGGETVLAARLEGVQPAVVTVISDTDTRAITPEWRMRRVADDAPAAVRAVKPTQDRGELEITVEFGVAP